MSDVVARLNAALSGQYRVERQLGEGGMATVYLADDLRHGRKVALKVLKPELAAVVGAERFLAEIRTTANLQHPHILPLFDSGEADRLLYYVMPSVEGESLRKRLDRQRQLPVDEAVRIATNVAEALDYAHRHGVIHRDIKPANILLLDGEPVIADFGIARAVSSGGADRLTETGLSLGTPHYMSPEQATGDQRVGPATDIWALGCVLHEMLVGEPPYTGSTPQAVLGKIITAEPPSASEVRKSVPPNVDAAIRKALEKLPADRFGSPQAFKRSVEDVHFRHDRGLADGRGSNRRRWVTAAAMIMAVVAVGYAWGRMASGPQAEQRARETSVAVLPFDNRGANPEDYFSDGFADQVIDALMRLPTLRVTNRTSSFALRGSGLDLRAIADSLGVTHLISGSVQQDGNRVLVAAQLIEARSGLNVWSATFDRELVDIIDVQREIARAIAGELGVELTEPVVDRMAVSTSTSVGAYDDYLRARQLFYQRTPEAFAGSIRAFERSIAVDPLYAPAHVGMSVAYALGVAFAAFSAPPDSLYAFLARSLAHADRAIELDAFSGEAYAARGYLLGGTSGDWDASERDLSLAIELQPSSADALGWYALTLSTIGRHDEAIDLHERALELDPVSPGRRMGYVYSALHARQPELALEQIRRARVIQPELGGLAVFYEALSLLVMERPEECLALDLSSFAAVRAMCLRASGRSEMASRMVDSLVAVWTPADSFLEADGVAMYFAYDAQADAALSWVERALAASPFSYSGLVWPPALWDPILSPDDGRTRNRLDDLRSAAHDRLLRERRTINLP